MKGLVKGLRSDDAIYIYIFSSRRSVHIQVVGEAELALSLGSGLMRIRELMRVRVSEVKVKKD